MRATESVLVLALAVSAGCGKEPRPDNAGVRAEAECSEELLPGMPDEPSISFRPYEGFEDVPDVAMPLPVCVKLEWHDYDVRLLSGRHLPPWQNQNKNYDLAEIDGVVIRKSGAIVYSRVEPDDSLDLGGWDGVPANAITDLDANGRSDLVLVRHTRGNHSHVWFTLCELEPEFRVVATLEGPADTARFVQLDGTPALEFVTADRNFDAWTCQADYVHIPIPLRIADGKWKVAVDLMERPAGQFACRDIEEWCIPESQNEDPDVAKAGMRYVVLDAIAAGRERDGWEALNRWTAISDEDKRRFVSVMRQTMDRSALWTEVRAAYAARK